MTRPRLRNAADALRLGPFLAAATAFALVTTAATPAAAPGPSRAARPAADAAIALLDRYLAGDFEDVVRALSVMEAYDGLVEELKRDGPAWVEAGGPADRPRRELAAATFALEAARAGVWKAWKEISIVPIPCERCLPAITLYRNAHWKAPPLIAEWGCELLRRSARPGPMEIVWQLAALGVAERSQDHEFLAGDQTQKGHFPSNVIPVAADPIRHLFHLRDRFPTEPRFKLAEAIAEEWYEPALARRVFEQLKDDVDVGGEATMRLGAMAFRARQDEDALADLRRVESLTRDPWVIHLARYFTGLVEESRRRPADAERAYRAALAAIPKAESASIALGSLLFRTGRRAEGSEVVEAMLNANPKPRDPWRTYADADDRFWPEYIAILRAEIRK